jgi:hypothetical protein
MDINRNNYETFFLLYLDRELEPADRQAVEKFLTENTDLQKEFTLLQQTILSPAEIVFEPRELLLRKEEKRKIVPMYWTRIAASFLVVLSAGWFILNAVSKNHKLELAGKDKAVIAKVHSGKYPVSADPNNKNQAADTGQKGIGEYKNQINQRGEKKLAVKMNSGRTIIQSRPINQTGDKDPGMKNQNDLTAKNNSGQQSQENHSVPGESQPAIQKSNIAIEIQPGVVQAGSDPKHISMLPGTQAPAQVFATNKSNAQLKNENADLKEQDFQSDNAISVVALNERNKAITGFFAKLTKRAPDNEKNNARKVRVSVFQISY